MGVLVVDGDPTCLAIISKILGTLGYEVVTATLGSSALSIVEQMKDELHLVLMEVHLPDIGIYELLRKMKEACKLPFFLMSTDANQISIVGASAEGAEHYFIKPVMIADLRGQWQFTARRDNLETGNWSLHSAKRKEPDKTKDKESIDLKRQKFTWTLDLHKKFMESMRLLGPSASPGKILEHMNVLGPEKDGFSSYLQHCPGPSNFGSREIWTCQELNYGQNPLIPPSNLAPSELMITDTNGKENATGGGIFKSDNPFLSYFEYTEEGNEMLYSAMLASYMYQLVPFPPPPFMVEEYGMLEDIIDGLIDFPKGADQFSDDEEFNLWLSTLELSQGG